MPSFYRTAYQGRSQDEPNHDVTRRRPRPLCIRRFAFSEPWRDHRSAARRSHLRACRARTPSGSSTATGCRTTSAPSSIVIVHPPTISESSSPRGATRTRPPLRSGIVGSTSPGIIMAPRPRVPFVRGDPRFECRDLIKHACAEPWRPRCRQPTGSRVTPWRGLGRIISLDSTIRWQDDSMTLQPIVWGIPRTVFQRIGIRVLLYMAICVLVLVDPPVVRMAAEAAPRWVGIVALTVTGPAVFTAAGIGAWKWFMGALACVAGCLGLAWLSWRRWPQSEVFAVWLLAAAVLWAGSGWLLVAFAV